MVNRQRLSGTLFILFLIVLAGLTLFSSTFRTAMLPKAVTEQPAKETLSHFIEGSGAIVPRHKVDLISQNGWKVAKVHKANNDLVKKGQLLVTFDDTTAKHQLLDEEDRLKKQILNREFLKEQYVTAYQEGDEGKIREAKRNLESDQLDMNIAQRKIDSMRKELSEGKTLTAPFDGRVDDLKAEEGMVVPQGQTLLTLVNTNEGYELTFSTDAGSADRLQVGEAVTPVLLKGENSQHVKGTITEIKEAQTEGGAPGVTDKAIVISVSGKGIQEGDQATVRMEKKAEQQGLVIRKEMLKKDGSGSYVFVVREKKSSLGNSYYAQKAYVTTGDENEEKIIILSGLRSEDDIISEASEPLQDGNQIRLYGED